jgi:endonuclease-3
MSIVSGIIKERGCVLRKVAEALEGKYGIPYKETPSNPLEVLISTILSQNTNARNCDLAFKALRRRFPNWESLLEADKAEIAETIKVGGLAIQKASNIKGVLRWICGRWGKLTLAPICKMGTEEARGILVSLKGIGPKTANCVLAFGCGREVFPVDTHILRITKRLGLVPSKVTAETAHDVLAPLIPAGKAISLHLNLIRYGKEICRALQPRCGLCVFPEYCTLPPEH